MPFDIKKFFSGFNIFNGQVVGKIIYFSIIASVVAAVSLGIYRKMTAPTAETHTQQKATEIINNYYPTSQEMIDTIDKEIAKHEGKFFLGVKFFGVKLGVIK